MKVSTAGLFGGLRRSGIGRQHDRRSVGDDLGHGATDLAAVEAHADHRIGSHQRRVLDHPIQRLTKKTFLDASHALVTYRAGGHRVIEEALERAGAGRRIALRVPHFTVVPMVLERTDLILTLPARVARVYASRGRFKSLTPPIPIPPAEVAVHWHERLDGDPGNRWLREQLVDLLSG